MRNKEHKALGMVLAGSCALTIILIGVVVGKEDGILEGFLISSFLMSFCLLIVFLVILFDKPY